MEKPTKPAPRRRVRPTLYLCLAMYAAGCTSGVYATSQVVLVHGQSWAKTLEYAAARAHLAGMSDVQATVVAAPGDVGEDGMAVALQDAAEQHREAALRKAMAQAPRPANDFRPGRRGPVPPVAVRR